MDSFKKVQGWIESIHNKAGENVVICLVGNKEDLKNTPGVQMVSQNDIDQFSKKFNLKYFSCSAKQNINIDESFSYLA